MLLVAFEFHACCVASHVDACWEAQIHGSTACCPVGGHCNMNRSGSARAPPVAPIQDHNLLFVCWRRQLGCAGHMNRRIIKLLHDAYVAPQVVTVDAVEAKQCRQACSQHQQVQTQPTACKNPHPSTARWVHVSAHMAQSACGGHAVPVSTTSMTWLGPGCAQGADETFLAKQASHRVPHQRL